jgi:predicted DNA-binding ribbon-helix-helix protein
MQHGAIADCMTLAPIKRSLTLHGHRTSVSLEPEFWEAFRAIAAGRKIPLNQLAAEIDDLRGGDAGLASAIRVFVLTHYRDAALPRATSRSP